jgi:hypothetical protein
MARCKKMPSNDLMRNAEIRNRGKVKAEAEKRSRTLEEIHRVVIREEFVDPGSRFNPGFLG